MHYHLIVLDGVFGKDGGGEIEFHEAYELTHDRVRQLEITLQRRVLRYFRRHGLLDEIDAAGIRSEPLALGLADTLRWQPFAGGPVLEISVAELLRA